MNVALPGWARSRRRLLGTVLVMLAAALAPACGADQRSESIEVFAASSLTAAFTDLAKEYERTHEGVTVKLNFASSSTLATQISNGAGADVFASADEPNMRKLAGEVSIVGKPRYFVHNHLTILVAAGNPGNITSLRDLSEADIMVAACAPQVPAGRYAREVFSRAGMDFPDASQELDVKQVVSRVRLGEVDAGIAYVSDAVGEDKLATVPIPHEHNVVARYPAAGLTGAGRSFVDFLFTDVAQQTLRDYGFTSPDGVRAAMSERSGG